MFISFFESIKHIGHLWPVALFRIFVGYNLINTALEKIHSQYLESPVMVDVLNRWLDAQTTAVGYRAFLTNWVIPHWHVASYIVVFGELAIGLSYVLGFMVRPAALFACVMMINYMLAQGEEGYFVNQVYLAAHIMIFLISAGRCIGLDYYFYKRVRGFWW